MLQVTDPTDDLQLLSQTELRLAIGLESSDQTQDTALATLGLRAAAALASACGVAKAGYASSVSPAITGVAPVTLKLESLTETFRFTSQQSRLYLARRPVAEVASITTDSSVLDSSEWELDVAQGGLIKLSSDVPCKWPCGKIVVAYDAGYETIPDDLKQLAARLVNTYYLSDTDDPNEKRVDIPGVIERERWVDLRADTIVPDDIMSALLRAGYRKPVYA